MGVVDLIVFRHNFRLQRRWRQITQRRFNRSLVGRYLKAANEGLLRDAEASQIIRIISDSL